MWSENQPESSAGRFFFCAIKKSPCLLRFRRECSTVFQQEDWGWPSVWLARFFGRLLRSADYVCVYHPLLFPILPSSIRTNSLSVSLRHGYNPYFCPLSFTHPVGIPPRSPSASASQPSPIPSVSFLLALRSPRMRFSISDDKFIT